MTYTYSVQFERFNNDEEKLLCSSMRLSDSVCRSFPVTCSSGYVAYKPLPGKRDLPDHEFWFSTVIARNETDAYQEAVLALYTAELDKPFPIMLKLIDDTVVKEMI